MTRTSIGIRPATLARLRAPALVAGMLLALGPSGPAQEKPVDSGLVAHEWGTFTSIAGYEGKAIEWFPWAVPVDLPDFVEHFRAVNFKPNLSGTIRMETPVVYFYSRSEATVSVHVRFRQGLITEWYPHASGFEPSGELRKVSLSERAPDGSLTWNSVSILPGERPSFAREKRASRYYSARDTAASPLRVSAPHGPQTEKFLFYRGVSSAAIPVTARFLPDSRLAVTNESREPVARMYLFERRGDAVGFHSVAGVTREAVLPPPVLHGSVAAISDDLVRTLVGQGLYAEEARAMLHTWRDSWFEEGARLIYIVPASFVNGILPLTISPAPGETRRVFVGRLELLSVKTRSAIETALATGDETTLAKYGRFLEPMLGILAASETDPVKLARIRKRLEQPYLPLVAGRLPN
jgi:hypothetical protein